MPQHFVTDKTRAIALVTPNNPGGVEYPKRCKPSQTSRASATLLIVVAYRDFDGRTGAPHPLFGDELGRHIDQHYSFSKAYQLGHRVRCLDRISRLAEVEEVPRHRSAPIVEPTRRSLGMRSLRDWLAGRTPRVMIVNRAAIEEQFPRLAAVD
jgi:hypothetical protein